MIPWHRADEVLDDLALDIDERRDVLGILAGQVGQQSLEVEVHVAVAGLGLQNVLALWYSPWCKIIVLSATYVNRWTLQYPEKRVQRCARLLRSHSTFPM